MNNNAKAETFGISGTKEILFSAAFTVLAVYTPILIHAVSGVDGGRAFLPMPFFVLLAGLLLGWRVGLATAIMSPIVSFLISGMPVIGILPFITVQLIAYGIVAGLLGKRSGAFSATLFAVVAGWLTIGISLFLFSKMNALNYVAQGVKAGIPGIVLQIILLPAVALLASKYVKNEK